MEHIYELSCPKCGGKVASNGDETKTVGAYNILIRRFVCGSCGTAFEQLIPKPRKAPTTNIAVIVGGDVTGSINVHGGSNTDLPDSGEQRTYGLSLENGLELVGSLGKTVIVFH